MKLCRSSLLLSRLFPRKKLINMNRNFVIMCYVIMTAFLICLGVKQRTRIVPPTVPVIPYVQNIVLIVRRIAVTAALIAVRIVGVIVSVGLIYRRGEILNEENKEC